MDLPGEYPTSLPHARRIRNTLQQTIDTFSFGRMMLDGRIDTEDFWNNVVIKVIRRPHLIRIWRKYGPALKHTYNTMTKTRGVIHVYMTLEELETRVLDAFRETRDRMRSSDPSLEIPPFETSLNWTTLKIHLEEELEHGIQRLHEERLKRKRELEKEEERISRDLEECERALKRFKKE
jgi:hypothetical protein